MIEDAVVAAGTCVIDDDCTLIGGQLQDFPTCDCAPSVLSCGGSAIANNAPGLATARQLIEELAACAPFDCSNGPVPCTCDCAPNDAVCDNGRCTTLSGGSCFPEPLPDAAVGVD